MDKNEDSIAKALQAQVDDLKAEIVELSGALSSRAGRMADRVAPAADAVKDAARQTAHSARAQGQAVADVVRENPGTATSIAVTAGFLGLAIGYMIGSATSSRGTGWIR